MGGRDLFVTLSTARIRLEPIREHHAPGMHDVLIDASLYRYMLSEVPPDVAWLRERYRSLEAGWSPDRTQRWLNWVVVERGTPIGYVQATVASGGGYATLGWTIGSRWQGRGFAREAVQAVCAHLLSAGVGELRATIDARNDRSIGVAERVGFRRVDTRRSDDVIDGVRGIDHDYVLREGDLASGG